MTEGTFTKVLSRIKGIMNYKKPGFWISTATVIILIIICILLITDGQRDNLDKNVISSLYIDTNTNKNDSISVEEIIKNHIPKIYNPEVFSNSLEYKGRWSGNVMPGLTQEMSRSGWDLYNAMGAKLFYMKEIDGHEVKISILPKEQVGPDEKNAATIVKVELEDSLSSGKTQDNSSINLYTSSKRELWTKDGWTYYIEQVPRGGAIPMDNYVGRLFRQNIDGVVEILDDLVKYEVGQSYSNVTILPAGERIVFIGFAGTEVMDFKTTTIISIREDGTGRRTYNPKFNVARQLCYDNGYLYYEGWTNAMAFPRPVCRINTDLTQDIKMADIDGSLITVHDGYAYYLNGSIYRLKLDWESKPEIWDKAAIGKDIFSVHKISDNEYEAIYNEEGERYILRLSKNNDSAKESINIQEPEGMHLVYYTGKPFAGISYLFYELDTDEAKRVQEAADKSMVLKNTLKEGVDTLPLILEFGSKDDRRYVVLDDGQTVFTEGKYYHNPELSKAILEIAKDKCGFEVFDTSVFTGIVEAKYTFKTKDRTYECLITERNNLAKIEKGLQEARHHMGGGCPFSDGVLTLTFENGKTMDVNMASDDCSLMFIEGNFLSYSKELHEVFENAFENFPYVKNNS